MRTPSLEGPIEFSITTPKNVKRHTRRGWDLVNGRVHAIKVPMFLRPGRPAPTSDAVYNCKEAH